MRLVQGPLGPLLADHPTRPLTDALTAGGDEAKRASEAMMPMKKIHIAAIDAARQGWHEHANTSFMVLDHRETTNPNS